MLLYRLQVKRFLWHATAVIDHAGTLKPRCILHFPKKRIYENLNKRHEHKHKQIMTCTQVCLLEEKKKKDYAMVASQGNPMHPHASEI